MGSMCYCAESSTGRELQDSKRQRGQAEEYCAERRERYEGSDCYQAMMAAKESSDESEPMCDDFGYYMPMQKDGSRNYCANRDGDELIETQGGRAGAKYCQDLRDIHDNSPCYQAQSKQTGFGSFVVCDVRTGLYEVTQAVGSMAYCVDQETGEKLKGTDHPISEAGRCGTIQDPYATCAQVRAAGEDSLVCNGEGMYFVQMCDPSDQTCICVNKWGDELDDSSRHHISEQACFEEERDDIRDSFSGSECEVERQISEALQNMGGYTAQCNDDGSFSRRQCTDYQSVGCFCLDSDGDYLEGSGHPTSEMRECGEVAYTFSSPKGDAAVEGASGSITCSVYASYFDESFEMLFDNKRYDERDMEMWGDVVVEKSNESFSNGTVRTTLSIFVDSMSAEMDTARFACVSRKNRGSIIRDIMVTTVVQDRITAVRIYNEKRGYVYAEDPETVIVREEVDIDDTNAHFERMDDNTVRSIAFDMCLAQTIEGKKIVIRLKECKGNPTQTWLQDTDDDGDARLYVLRPGKKGKQPTPYFLDYFKQELTGYKETNKANQKWDLINVSEQF